MASVSSPPPLSFLPLNRISPLDLERLENLFLPTSLPFHRYSPLPREASSVNVDNRAVYSRFFPRLLFFSLNRKFEIRGGGRKTRVRIGRRISNETREFSLHHSTALSPRFEMTNLAWRVPRVREGGCCSLREDGERGRASWRQEHNDGRGFLSSSWCVST